MRWLLLVLFPSLFLIAACDSAGDPAPPIAGAEEVRYRTALVDRALGAAALPDGSFVVAGSTEGAIGLGDWTNAFPLLLRVSGAGVVADTTVYRDVRYGEAHGAVPFQGGLAVLVAEANFDEDPFEPPALTLYRASANGTREGVLFELANTFPTRQPLLPTADGGLLLVLSRGSVDDDDLVKLDGSGHVSWTYRMPEVQHVVGVAEASDGSLFVLGVRDDARRYDLARLHAGGHEAWRRVYGDDAIRSATAVAAMGEGAAVLTGLIGPGVETAVVAAFSGDGEPLWENEYVACRSIASALAGLPDGGLAFGYAERYGTGEGGIGQTRAYVMRLSPDGVERWRRPFGPREGTTTVSAIVPLDSGRLVVVGSTGPEFIDGYGDDDFDVVAAFYGGG